MPTLDNEIIQSLKGAQFSEISFSTNEVIFHFKTSKNYKIVVQNIGDLIIEPRNFDCPNSMSMHTQILWLIDEIYPFLGKEILDTRIADGQIIALQFANGAIGLKLDVKILGD